MWVPEDIELFFDFETGTLNTTVMYDFAAEGNIPVSHSATLIPAVAPNLPSAHLSASGGGASASVSTTKPSLEGIFPLVDITYLTKSGDDYVENVVTDWGSVPFGKRVNGFNANSTTHFIYDLVVVANGVTPPPVSAPLVQNRTYTITILNQYETNRNILLQKVSEEDTNDH
jgi:hypothetical protein